MRQPGVLLAERLGLKILGTEGHDLKTACVSCQSSDAGRVHQDTGVYFCFSCQKALSAWDLCKLLVGHEAAKKAMIEVGLFQEWMHDHNGSDGLKWLRPTTKPPDGEQPAPAADANSVPWLDSSDQPAGDILAKVAAAKGVAPESFLAYGAEVDGDAVFFPMHGPDGEVCSGFSLTLDNGKGCYAKGKPVGLFLPGRKPVAGETWCIVEGCKDAAVVHNLGILAVGLPGNRLNEKFAPLFAGCDIIVIPDADRAGVEGADETAKVLAAVAKSVRVARLPVPVVESGGKDVRDVLREQGPAAVLTAIGDAQPAKAAEPPAFTKLITCSELLALDLKPRFLVRGVLVEGQPMIVGGRSKVLKTSIACDLVLSLAAGRPFLGKFDSHRVNVGFWSGETGAAVLRETAQRIAAAKGIDLADCFLHWSFDLPKLSRLDHLDHFAATIDQHGLQVAVVDPLYLSLLDPATASNAGNIYTMGTILQPLSALAQEHGASLTVLHHFRKSGVVDDDEPAGLEELAQSGVAEWARQWILLQRRVPYEGDGKHSLWMRCGGSAGHSSLWHVSIDEGQLNPDTFTGRTWDVLVSPAADARRQTEQDRENRKAVEQEKRQGEHRERLLEVLRKVPDGDTAKGLREAAGLNPANFSKAISCLVQEGRAERCQVTKNGAQYDAYKPTGK